jgi:sensor domain CHASE-containing protein
MEARMNPSPENRPEDWTIVPDVDGFFIVDADGFEVLMGWRSKSYAAAAERLRAMINEALEDEEREADEADEAAK